MGDLRLPKELTSFSKNGKQFQYDSVECEPGLIRLLSHEDLTIMMLYVCCETAPFAEEDPNYGSGGCYAVPAVNLVAECLKYTPEGILVWLPDTMQFATWDCDHAVLRTFPGVSWARIVANPVPFINCQWSPDEVPNEIYKPWPRHRFHEGWFGAEDPPS